MADEKKPAAIQKTVAKTVADLIEAHMPEIRKLIPQHVTPERLLKVMVSAINKTPSLQQCTPASLMNCFRVAAELGLEPGGALGHLYLVPYKTEATPLLGYKGMLHLMRQSGMFDSARAVIVHEKDEWDYTEGLDQTIVHRPSEEADPGPMVRVYCVLKYASGTRIAEVMSRAQVDAIRARSSSARSGRTSPWDTDYEEMAKKTVLRRAAKWGPMSSVVAEALEREDEDERELNPVTANQTAAASIVTTSATQAAKAAVTRKLNAVDLTTKPTPPAPVTSSGPPPDSVPLPTEAEPGSDL